MQHRFQRRALYRVFMPLQGLPDGTGNKFVQIIPLKESQKKRLRDWDNKRYRGRIPGDITAGNGKIMNIKLSFLVPTVKKAGDRRIAPCVGRPMEPIYPDAAQPTNESGEEKIRGCFIYFILKLDHPYWIKYYEAWFWICCLQSL